MFPDSASQGVYGLVVVLAHRARERMRMSRSVASSAICLRRSLIWLWMLSLSVFGLVGVGSRPDHFRTNPSWPMCDSLSRRILLRNALPASDWWLTVGYHVTHGCASKGFQRNQTSPRGGTARSDRKRCDETFLVRRAAG